MKLKKVAEQLAEQVAKKVAEQVANKSGTAQTFTREF